MIIYEKTEDTTTTSATAAAVWFPFLAEDKRVDLLAKETFEMMSCYLDKHPLNLTHDSDCSAAPIVWLDAETRSEGPNIDLPSYVETQPMEKKDLRISDKEWLFGCTWRSILMQSHLYLPMLRRLCARTGIEMKYKHLDALPPFEEGTCFINCLGLGAKQVAGDDELFAVQGTVVKVDYRKPGRKFVDGIVINEAEQAYVIPRSDCTVLGGTAFRDVYSKENVDSVVEGIKRRCDQLVEGISKHEVLSVTTDLRPARKRLALGWGKKGKLFNCYGFGGSGWTVHLGAVKCVVQAMDAKSKL